MKASFYEHSLMLMKNVSFMKNITLLREDSERQVKRESLEYSKKIVEENPVDHKALFNLGNSFFNLEKYEKSIACYQRIIESQSDLARNRNPYYYLKYLSFDRLIDISPHVFSSSPETNNLLDKTKSMSCKITSRYRLLLLRKWIAITDTFESLLKEKALLQENIQILEFTLSAYIIYLLKQENGNRELLEVAKSWLSLIKIKHNDEESKKLFLQFIYFTVMLTAKEHLPLDKLEKVLDEVKNRIPISDVLFILLRAIKNPTTREAQKWMADPLFKTIVEKLGAEKETNTG